MNYRITHGRVECVMSAASKGNRALVLAEIRAEVIAALSKAMHEVSAVWNARGEAEDFKELADEMIVVTDPFDIPPAVGRVDDGGRT